MIKIFLKLFLLFSITVVAQQKTRFNKIDSLLVYLNQNNKFMGQVCIREAGTIVFDKTYGFTDLAKNSIADSNTKYKVGSISKTFTAVIIMQLLEEKKLKINTKLSKYYPQIPNAGKITIHDLLHHRTGILDFLNGDKTVNVQDNVSKEQMIAKITAYESVFEPNSKFEYSNSNYFLLGCIIEDVTKKNYAVNLEERICAKIRMNNTFIVTQVETEKNEALSYSFNENNWALSKEWNMSQFLGSGNIASTAIDLTLFFDALFSEKLLKKTSVDEMMNLEQSYGKGLMTFPFGERKFYGHTGGIEGFRAVVGYYPKEKTGISLIVNGDNYNRNDIMIGILSIFYKMPYQFPNLITFNVNKTILNQYEGVYSSKEIPIKITLKVDKDQISAQATGQNAFTLNAISETEFVFDPAGIKLIFEGKKMTLKQGVGQYLFVKD